MLSHIVSLGMIFFLTYVNLPISTRPTTSLLSNGVYKTSKQSWIYFLQHLPIIDASVVDYKGKPVGDNQKSMGIIPYDVGKADLQQCADALIRLRAEYLYLQSRYNEIGFHFVSGHLYTWKDFRSGKRPVTHGNSIRFVQSTRSDTSHQSLRRYLDIVYTYASTISLARELKNADEFAVGTIVIYAGSPGHCFIIIDEKLDANGNKLFKLAEGYTPAQSIYVLRNLSNIEKSPWYQLNKGTIETASYTFTKYQLKKFE